MQTFVDSSNNQVWQFDDDVVPKKSGSAYSFLDARGNALSVPATLIPYTPDKTALVQQAGDAQIAALKQACQDLIVGGFTSQALGAPYTYPSTLVDQQNLAASVIDSTINGNEPGWTTPFPCADASGVWARRPHTQAQIQKVGSDGKAAVTLALSRLDAAVAKVNESVTALQTPAQIQTIAL